MVRALITGSRGFVGGHLAHHLASRGDEVAELPEGLDLRERSEVLDLFGAIEFDVCYHLAAISHVGLSWENPYLVYENNVLGTANVVEGLSRCNRSARLVFISSSEVYGRVQAGDLPVTEDARLMPATPYAASKAAGEQIALQAYFGSGVPVVVARSFNHTGIGQPADFVVPGIVSRLVAAKRSGKRALRVGNVESRRDFSDVRDVVRAYRLIGEEGGPGEAYNVASGTSLAISEIIEMAASIVGVEVDLEVDPGLLRPSDVPEIVGSIEKIAADTGYQPSFAFRDTLAGMVRHSQE